MNMLRDRAGVTGVDFAVACGTVFILIFATIDFGRLFALKHAANYGVYKAARYAAVNSASATQSSIKSSFVNYVTPVIGATQAQACTVTASFPGGETVGGTVVVNASCNWSPAAVPVDNFAAATVSASETLTIQH